MEQLLSPAESDCSYFDSYFDVSTPPSSTPTSLHSPKSSIDANIGIDNSIASSLELISSSSNWKGHRQRQSSTSLVGGAGGPPPRGPKEARSRGSPGSAPRSPPRSLSSSRQRTDAYDTYDRIGYVNPGDIQHWIQATISSSLDKAHRIHLTGGEQSKLDPLNAPVSIPLGVPVHSVVHHIPSYPDHLAASCWVALDPATPTGH
jgi:hypothetical protein